MQALPTDRFAELFEPLDAVAFNHLFARVVLEGKAPGAVFVDALEHPRLSCVRLDYGMSLLFGDPDALDGWSALWEHLERSPGKRRRVEWLQAYPPVLGERICDHFGFDAAAHDRVEEHPSIEKHTRINFEFDEAAFRAAKRRHPPLEPGLELVRTGPGEFAALPGTVVPKFFWRDPQTFAEIGAGYSLVCAGEVVSGAFSAFVTGRFLEIGIETRAAHHGKGYAFHVCAALLDHCLDQGLIPVWACRQVNVGSMKLAQKLGFRIARRIPYLQLKAHPPA